jgi:hypothetical protein
MKEKFTIHEHQITLTICEAIDCIESVGTTGLKDPDKFEGYTTDILHALGFVSNKGDRKACITDLKKQLERTGNY